MNPSVKKKPTQTDEGELFIGMVPKIQNYQKGKIYLYQEEKDLIEKAHRADIRRLGFSQLRDILQSVFKNPDKIIGKKERELFFQKRIDRSRSILVKVRKEGVGYKVAELIPIVHDRKLSSMNLNTYWKKEEPATEAVKESEPTKEMVDFFKKRTAKHIERAAANIDVIIKAFPELKNLEKRKASHDASKYGEDEYLPYIWYTEFHRVNNSGGKFEYPPGMEEKVTAATKHHITVNKHHPEAHKTTADMSKEDLAEMVADWAAMSQELGTGLKKWADGTISKKWKFSKDQIDFIYSLINVFEKPAVEYVIKPEDTETLWYENAKGKKWYPDYKNLDSLANPPKGYIYQVSKFPNEVRENMLREVLPEEVEKCKHPEENISKTYGWVDGMEGRECALCKGTQLKKIKDDWPEKWEAHGSRSVLTMSTTWTEQEVMALVNDAGYSLHEAIQLATSMCGRCLSSLLYDNDSKEAEFAEFSLDWFNENVSCKHCEDHRMDPIDEEKLRRYRSNAPVYLGILESRFKKPEYKRSKKHWQAQYDLIKKRLSEYEKKLGKLWGVDLKNSQVATEKATPFDFTKAIGKPFSVLQGMILDINGIPKSTTLVLRGNKTVIETARGMEVEVQYVVVPQALLTASHSAQGKRNPEFPGNFQNASRDRMKAKLQNRDRSSTTSQYQADQMSKNIRPRLLGANPFASDGAPVTNSKLKPGKYVVLSGNARAISLGLACERKNDSNDKYLEWLEKESRNFGIDPGKVSQIACPRLLRNVVKEMKGEELTKFVKQSNKPSIQAPSAQEVAVEDASEISTDMLKLISPTKDGRIEGAANINFINVFFQKVLENDPAEVGRMRNKEGELTDEGVDRITRSVIMRAYGDPTLIDKLIRRGDDDSKKLTKGLMMAAPEMAKLGDDLAKADRLDLDISSDIIKAVMELEAIRSQKGRTVEDALAFVSFDDEDVRNDPAIVELLRGLEKLGTGYRGKPDNVKSFLLSYVNQANNAVQESEMETGFASAFGEAEYDKEKMLAAARKSVATEAVGDESKTEDIKTLAWIIASKKGARSILEGLVGDQIATEKVNGIDFNSALGKSISFLQELIESVVVAEEIATEAWIDDLAGNKASLGKLPIDLEKSIEDTEFRPFGAWKGEAVKGSRNKLSPTRRLEVNKESENILKKSRQDMTEDDLKTLQQYSGFGGTKSEEGEEIETGILYDYYTSPPVALAGYKIIDNLFKIKPGMTACEPSCGNGVYMEVAPPGVKMTGIEYDARSSACADSLHDEAKVHNSSFEEFNLHSDEKFDLVIGNAPFGDRSGDTQYLDDPDEKNMDRYFLKASIKRLKPNGMLGLIVHSGVFENEKNKEWRKELLKLGKFQGAIRLPSESFQHTDTQVSPDMIFFRRHDETTQDRIDLAEEGELEATGIYAAVPWIEGSKEYYRAYPRHKLGEDEKGNFGQIYTKGRITAKILDSAISGFKPYEYSINTYELGQRQIEESRTLEPGPRVQKLSESEAKAVANKDLRKGKIKIEEGAVYMLNDKYEWEHLIDAEGEDGEKIGRVLNLSQIIRQIRTKMQNDEPVDSLQKDGKELIQKFKDDFGDWQYDDKDIKRFFKQNSKIAGFEGVDITIDHEILTNQNIYQKEIKYKDGHNIGIKALMSYQDKNILEVTTEQARDYAPTFGDAIVDELYNNGDIFLDPDLKWQLRENFIEGSAWDKISALEIALEGKHNPQDIEKLEYSISELKSKAGWTSLEDIAPRPFDKWLPKEIVVAWLETHDMDRKVYYNEETGKWDAKDWQDKLDPEGAKYMRFLNRESQRGDTDTKRYNETKTEDFERFISTDQASRAKIEEAYNKTYGGKIKGPNKTYPIDIDGWNADIVLFPHQWQSVHHLARKGTGTNGSFVGSGKTMAQIALFALLRQEGKVKRGFGQVPNNKVRDWVQEFKMAMPGLNVGYIDAKGEDLDDADRNRRLQKLANGSYDIVILPESIATRLGLSAGTNEIIDTKIVMLQTKDEKSAGQKTARAKVKSKEAAAKRVQAGDLTSNQTVTFDDFNFDFMFIDESHNGKAIFKSKKSRGLGFKGGRESNRAMAMYKKMEAVRLKTGGKYTFGNTATPISNSPIELFNQMHLMGGGDELQRRGIFTIDDFVDEFCEVEETVMVDWATSQTKVGKKLVGFTRVDKLQEMFREYVDYQHDPDAVDLKKPTATYVANEIPVNEVQKDAVLGIRNQLKEWKNDKERLDKSNPEEVQAFNAKWGGSNYLTFFSKLRTASLDLELFDPEANKGWKNPKLEELAKKAWDNFERTGGGQVVFCDRVLSSSGDFSMHNKIKDALVTVGFKGNEIVIVNGQVKGGLGRAKLAESKMESVVTQSVDGFNAGRYRVIIGTTNTLGEGVNLQRNSGGLHHFDIPYRPSDFIQRNGRIDRQGNEQQRVELNTYVSKGSIDSYSKGIVSDKENWINQLLNTTSNVFANPDEGFDENSLELAMAEEFDTPEHVEQLKIELKEKQKQAELDYNENQVKKVLPKFELISGAIWEFKGDKGSQIYQNMLRKREEYKKDLEKNPEFKNADLLQEENPFYFEKETGTIYRQGDYFSSKRGIHQLTKVNPKKGTMELTPIDETWKKTQRDAQSIRGRGFVSPPDHKGYTIKGELPSGIKHMPELKTPERLSQMETVFADDSAGFYEQPLDFQIENYKDFFNNRDKKEIPFYFHEKGGKLILDTLSYSDDTKNISKPVHPEKAAKEFGKRLLNDTASIEISSYGDDDQKVIAKVGQETWNDWKKAEQQGEHPWLTEAYKHLDKWISKGDLEKKLAGNEDFKNDLATNKISAAFKNLPDIESRKVDDQTFYIKKSQLKRGLEGDEYEIFEVASRNSQLSPENLKTAQSNFIGALKGITWEIDQYPKYYKDDVEKILDENLSVKGDDKEKTATELIPLLKEYHRKEQKAKFDEENEIRKSQGMTALVEMSDKDIRSNLEEYVDGFRGEQMERYKPQGEEAAKYFTLKDMVKMFDDYKLQKELTEIEAFKEGADNKKDVSRVTKEYIKEKKDDLEMEFETFIAAHNQKVKSAVNKVLSDSPQTKFPIRELRDVLPFHTPVSDGDFSNILLEMQRGDEIDFDGQYVSSKDYKEPEPEPVKEPEKPAAEPADTDRPEQETVKTADTDLTIKDFTHTKTGELFRLVKMGDQVSRDRFNEMKGKSKYFDGYYNRYAKGFMFKDPVKAREFANSFKA